MTQEFMSVHHPGQPRRGGRPDRKPGGVIPFLRKQESHGGIHGGAATCWIPAFAGMVTGHSMTQEFMSVHHPGQPRRGGRGIQWHRNLCRCTTLANPAVVEPDRKPGGVIPFLRKQESPPSHSCESRNPWRCCHPLDSCFRRNGNRAFNGTGIYVGAPPWPTPPWWTT